MPAFVGIDRLRRLFVPTPRRGFLAGDIAVLALAVAVAVFSALYL
jgi:hypothetical protein